MTDHHTRPSLEAVLTRHGLDRLNEGPGHRKVLCPYHDERRPSATANYDTGRFNCFACSRAGDVYALLMEQESLTFKEALELGDQLDADPNVSAIPTGSQARKKRAWKPPGRRGRR